MSYEEMTQEELELFNERLKTWQLELSMWAKNELPRTIIFGVVFVTLLCYLSSSLLSGEMLYSWYVLGPCVGTILSLPLLAGSLPKKPTKHAVKFDVAVMKSKRRNAGGSND